MNSLGLMGPGQRCILRATAPLEEARIWGARCVPRRMHWSSRQGDSSARGMSIRMSCSWPGVGVAVFPALVLGSD